MDLQDLFSVSPRLHARRTHCRIPIHAHDAVACTDIMYTHKADLKKPFQRLTQPRTPCDRMCHETPWKPTPETMEDIYSSWLGFLPLAVFLGRRSGER